MPEIIEDIRLDIDQNNVLKRLMKRGFRQTQADLKQQVRNILDHISPWLDPKIVYKDMSIMKKSHDMIQLNSHLRFESSSLVKHLHDAEFVTIYVATIGEDIEAKVAEFKENNSLKSLIFDTIGSEAAETLAHKVSQFTKNRAKTKGYKDITRRFSPGYGDLYLRSQKKIFNLLQPERVGVKLSKSNIMQPEKTTSGVIGWICSNS